MQPRIKCRPTLVKRDALRSGIVVIYFISGSHRCAFTKDSDLISHNVEGEGIYEPGIGNPTGETPSLSVKAALGWSLSAKGIMNPSYSEYLAPVADADA